MRGARSFRSTVVRCEKCGEPLSYELGSPMWRSLEFDLCASCWAARSATRIKKAVARDRKKEGGE
jgi:hypothetical protein